MTPASGQSTSNRGQRTAWVFVLWLAGVPASLAISLFLWFWTPIGSDALDSFDSPVSAGSQSDGYSLITAIVGPLFVAIVAPILLVWCAPEGCADKQISRRSVTAAAIILLVAVISGWGLGWIESLVVGV